MAEKETKKKKLPKNVRERNGRFYYRYDITDPQTGKRKQKETKGFATARDAEKEGIRIQAELIHGTYVEEDNITFNSFVNKWLEIYSTSGRVKGSTVRLRKKYLKTLSKYFGSSKLKDITKLSYQAALNDLKAIGRSKNTINSIHASGSLLFASAVDLDLIKSNPAKNALVPAFQETVEQLENGYELPKFLEKEELALFLRTAKESGLAQDYAIFVTLAYTGLRVGELCCLRWRDIDRINKQISIKKTLFDEGYKANEYALNTPKTKSSIREVSFSNTVLSVLVPHELWQKEFRMLKRNAYYKDESFVFISTYKHFGYPITINLVDRRMKRLLKLAGLPTNLTPHSLRHTHTSLLAEAGVSLEAIQERLGHKNNDITREIYLHITKKQKLEAPDKFDLLMGSI